MKTTAETLSVNGVDLNTLAKNIDSLTGRLRAPSLRTSNLTLPGMNGELWVPNKKYSANIITLPMWVQGCDDDGNIPEGGSARKEFFKRVNELVALFKTPGLLDVRWTKADGLVRQCMAEATDVFDFTTDTEGLARVGVVLTIPSAFWQDVGTTEQKFTGNLASGSATNFIGGSAPIEDMIYELRGPWTNAEVMFPDGSYFRYNVAITSTQGLNVDVGEWELVGVGGLVPDYSKLVHDGEDSYWGALPAAPTAAPVIRMNGSARTTATSLTMRGRRKYLIG